MTYRAFKRQNLSDIALNKILFNNGISTVFRYVAGKKVKNIMEAFMSSFQKVFDFVLGIIDKIYKFVEHIDSNY